MFQLDCNSNCNYLSCFDQFLEAIVHIDIGFRSNEQINLVDSTTGAQQFFDQNFADESCGSRHENATVAVKLGDRRICHFLPMSSVTFRTRISCDRGRANSPSFMLSKKEPVGSEFQASLSGVWVKVHQRLNNLGYIYIYIYTCNSFPGFTGWG